MGLVVQLPTHVDDCSLFLSCLYRSECPYSQVEYPKNTISHTRACYAFHIEIKYFSKKLLMNNQVAPALRAARGTIKYSSTSHTQK